MSVFSCEEAPLLESLCEVQDWCCTQVSLQCYCSALRVRVPAITFC